MTKIIKTRFKPIKKQKQVKLFIYYTKFKTSNLIVKNNTNLAKIFLNQTNRVYELIFPFRKCLPPKSKISTLVIQLQHYLVAKLITFQKGDKCHKTTFIYETQQ